jgi:hypothetical protein
MVDLYTEGQHMIAAAEGADPPVLCSKERTQGVGGAADGCGSRLPSR